jgi:ATP-dependent Clp protease ATP-binding subunit ClpA
MFERFDETARRALFAARQEALALGAPLITPDHIVLGVLREADPVTRRTLEGLGFAVSSVRDAFPRVEESIQFSMSDQLPLSEDAKKVLAYASHIGESERLKNVGAVHLFLGVFRVAESAAAKTLGRLGLTYEKVGEASRPILAEMAADETREEEAPLVLRTSHCIWLDQLAANSTFRPGARATRQEIVHAIMDALAETGLAQQELGSLQDLTNALKETLQARWPKP